MLGWNPRLFFLVRTKDFDKQTSAFCTIAGMQLI